MVTEPQPGPRPRRWRLALGLCVLCVLLVAGGAVAGLLWWHSADPVTRPLEDNWAQSSWPSRATDGSAASTAMPIARASPIRLGWPSPRTDRFSSRTRDASPRIRRLSTSGTRVNGCGRRPRFRRWIRRRRALQHAVRLSVSADGTLYVADTANNAIRRITADGVVSTLAGDGEAGDADGPARSGAFQRSDRRRRRRRTAASSSPTPTTTAFARSIAMATSRRSPARTSRALPMVRRPRRASTRRRRGRRPRRPHLRRRHRATASCA